MDVSFASPRAFALATDRDGLDAMNLNVKLYIESQTQLVGLAYAYGCKFPTSCLRSQRRPC